jgi:ribose transport system permease protein
MTSNDSVAQPSGPAPSRIAGLGSRLPLARLAPYSGLLIWAILILYFWLEIPDTFFTLSTLRSVASDEAITAMMALALLAPLAAGVFDLSIAGTMGLAVILVAYFQARQGMSPALAILLTLAIGTGIGLVNALVVVKLRVDSFIGTLGMSSVLLAAIQWPTGGEQIFTGIPESFVNLASWKLVTIPVPFFYMLVLAVVIWYVLGYRQVGRYLYAIGSNPEAARLAGVRTDLLRALSLVFSATVATLAGIVFTAKIGSASPDSSASYLLPAFAGAFLGATQITSGRFNVPGTLLAVYLLATGVKGLQLMGQPSWVNDLFNGCALIVAVAMAGLVERRVAGARRRGAGSASPSVETGPSPAAEPGASAVP